MWITGITGGALIFFTNMPGYVLVGNENGVFWVDVVLLPAVMCFMRGW